MENNERAAFPISNPTSLIYAGLTKRELLAVMAMQGHLARMVNERWDQKSASHAAKLAVMTADALLTELEKEE